MKTLRLLLNIGKRDAQRLGLKETLAGKSVTVEPDAADEMVRRGWAVEPDRDRDHDHDAPALEAVPTTSATLAPSKPTPPEEMTIEELRAHAEALKIPGLAPSASKDEILKALKKVDKPR